VCRAWRDEWKAKVFQDLIAERRFEMYNLYTMRPKKIFAHSTSLVKADQDGGFWSVRFASTVVTHTYRDGHTNDAYFVEGDDMVNEIAVSDKYLFLALIMSENVVRVRQDGTDSRVLMDNTVVTAMAALSDDEIVIEEKGHITLYNVGGDTTYPLANSILGSNLTSSHAGVAWICPSEDASTTIQWVTYDNLVPSKLKFNSPSVLDIAIDVIDPLVASISNDEPASIGLFVERTKKKTKKVILNYSSSDIRLWARYNDLVLLSTTRYLVVLNSKREVATFIALPVCFWMAHSYNFHACFTATGKIVVACELGIFVY